MRVHLLEIKAFGPFAGTEVIDFDAHNEAGLFLLTGPTGAGKTSILDAICFALYGAVPGARNQAKDLKSHHAPPDVAPHVVLELTVRGRRFRLRRSPAWTRPSRRAKAGMVDENAKASIEEQTGGHWATLATRLDDVGLQVSSLLGMTRDQFCQVVMLPQGDFQTFLRAGAKERHDLLESLFDTRRFARIERWLVDHRRSCEQRLQTHEATLVQLVARAHEVLHDELSSATTVDVSGAAAVETPERPDLVTASSRLEERAAAIEQAAAEAAQSAEQCGKRVKVAQHAYDEALTITEQRQRHAAARARLDELQATVEVVHDRARRVDSARAAQAFVPLLRLIDQTRDDRDSAWTTATSVLADLTDVGLLGLPDLLPASVLDLDDDVLAAAADGVRSRAREAEGLVAAAREARVLTDEIEAADLRLADVSQQLARCEELAADVPLRIAEAVEERDLVTTLAASVDAATETLRRCRVAARAATAAEQSEQHAAQLRLEEHACQQHQLAAKSYWLDLRERRLAGMAAELAGRLRPGSSCLVCGSESHPAPALATDDQVTAEAEESAYDSYQQASAAVESVQSALVIAATASARWLAVADGLRPAEADAAVELAAARLDDAVAAQRSRTRAEERVAALQGKLDELSTTRHQLAMEQRLVEERRQVGVTELHTLTTRLDTGPPDGLASEELLSGCRRALQTLATLERAHTRWRHVDDSHGAGLSQLASLLESSVFDTADDVRAATMTEPEIAAADALNRAYAEEVATARRVVDDPVLASAARQPPPDLEELHERLSVLRADDRQAAARAHLLASRCERLAELTAALRQGLVDSAPLRARYELAAEVASLCTGTSAANLTKTKLSHYVLAARLEQVVAAANVRLAGVSSGRYQLQHTMARGVGDSRGGLGLHVLDNYTGQARDPATLSGGETFYVSLALALGLADLVRDEAGGTELSTLFVDEGFGSLDSDTLDEVMDEVDALRSGGRSVGIVSHLVELRTRIPSRITVCASPAGSTISTS